MKILLTGGGTAGHIMPHIAILPNLKTSFNEIIYMGAANSLEKKLIEAQNIPFYAITVVRFDRGNIFANFKIPFLLHKGIKEAKKLLIKLKPDIVFAKGGYVSLPVVIAAKKLKIPIAIHESDYTMGLSNRICSRYANIIMTNFSETAKQWDGIAVGIPLREELFTGSKVRAYNFINVTPRQTILVTGGSLGAIAINECVRVALPILLKNYNVVHLTGKGKKAPELNPSGYVQIEYSNNMPDLIALADIVISRAGANTTAELIALNKKMILIPLERATRGDQIKNAEELSRLSLATVIMERELNPKRLIDTIDALINAPQPSCSYNHDTNKLIVKHLFALANKLRHNGK